MDTEDFVENVDAAVIVGETQEEVKNDDSTSLQMNSSTDLYGFVTVNNEQLVKCNNNLVTIEDGTLWYKIPIMVPESVKVDQSDDQIEIWEDIEIKNEDENRLEESIVEEERHAGSNEEDEPVAAQVIVLDNGTIAYITQPTKTVISSEDVEVESKPKSIKKKNKSPYSQEPDCERSFPSLHHLKVRNLTADRPYKCPIDDCDKAFATLYSRKVHLRTHTGEKPYPCTTCHKCFKTSGDLQKHVRTHTGERPFVCPVEGCNRSFTTSNIRKVHVRTHTGERPYTCTYENCNRRFASSTNYKNHLRIHSGEKPFCCPLINCEKRFTEYSSLYKHQLVHSQVKRYKCPFCYKIYRQMSTLTTHKRTIHGVILSEDGTEITIEVAKSGDKDALKTFKNVAINLLNLKKDRSNKEEMEKTLVTLDEDNAVYIVTNENNASSI